MILFTSPVLTGACVNAWTKQGVQLKDGEVYDVGILLGGMGKYNPEFNRVGLNADGDRIWQTLELYHSGKIKKILISSFNGSIVSQELNEAEMFKKQLVSWGIKSGDILIESKSRNTYENAKFTRELIDTSYPHLKSFVLITSTMHMRRAEACFKKQGFKVQIYPTGIAGEGPVSYMDFILPDAANFEIWKQLLKEMVGFATYKIMGYL